MLFDLTAEEVEMIGNWADESAGELGVVYDHHSAEVLMALIKKFGFTLHSMDESRVAEYAPELLAK